MTQIAVFLLWFWNPGYTPPRWDYFDKSFNEIGDCGNYKLKIIENTPMIFAICSDHKPRWEPRDSPADGERE
jgi:hypothetical protein